MPKLTEEDIIHKSGANIPQGKFETLKQKNFICLDETAGGDAPKDVIKVYEYGRCRKEKPKSWVKYIAKIGHKWYPNESITEHYLTQIGKCFGIEIADSKLVFVESYIRFLSEHFHGSEQSLEHGANILSRYINESNTEWIDEMDKNRTLKGEITIIDIVNAINDVFIEQSNDILEALVHMLLFDALSGNNDRHYYNWGVITHIKNKHVPYFSPVYDSARGLFWNKSDKNIISLHTQLKAGDNKAIIKYVNNSAPKVSIPGNDRCNHFQLVEYLKNNNYISNNHRNVWTNKRNLDKAVITLNTEFKHLFIKERRIIIEEILNLRFNRLVQILEA
jgi:hypothetical protein